MTTKTWDRDKDQWLRELHGSARDLGAKISGEHGIGLKRKPYRPDVTNPVATVLMRAITRAWDPHSILNPDKVFDLQEHPAA